MIQLATPLQSTISSFKIKTVGLDFIHQTAQITGAYYTTQGDEGEGITISIPPEDFLAFYKGYTTHQFLYTQVQARSPLIGTISMTGEPA